jgi:hypothetical protein
MTDMSVEHNQSNTEKSKFIFTKKDIIGVPPSKKKSDLAEPLISQEKKPLTAKAIYKNVVEIYLTFSQNHYLNNILERSLLKKIQMNIK